MATLKERVDRHDREIAAIRKIILAGMRMVAKHDEYLLRLEADLVAYREESRREMRELRAQQRATARELEAFIRSLRGSNGRSRLPE
jgi:hypothetical protein